MQHAELGVARTGAAVGDAAGRGRAAKHETQEKPRLVVEQKQGKRLARGPLSVMQLSEEGLQQTGVPSILSPATSTDPSQIGSAAPHTGPSAKL